ncbi:MAG: RusA family crossover junction endodeoxyribonuclease [Candidatus Omnitrophota bacterium]
MKFIIPMSAKPFVMLTQKTKWYAAGQEYAAYKDSCFEYMIAETKKEERESLGACDYLSLSITAYLPMIKKGKISRLTGKRGDATNILKAVEDGIYNKTSPLGNDKKNLKVSSEIRTTTGDPWIEVEILPWEVKHGEK